MAIITIFVVILLSDMNAVFSYTQVHKDLIEIILVKHPDCLTVLYYPTCYNHQLEFVNIKPSLVLSKSIFLDKKGSYNELFLKEKCVTVIIGEGSDFRDFDLLSVLLSRTRYRSILAISVTEDLKRHVKESHLKEDVTFVDSTATGNLRLSAFCYSTKGQPFAIWFKESKSFYSHQQQQHSLLPSCSRSLKGKMATVLTYQLPSYVIYLPGKRYGGSEFDLLNIIAKKVGFNYSVKEGEDIMQSYGNDHTRLRCEGAKLSNSSASYQLLFGSRTLDRPTDVKLDCPNDFSPQLYASDLVLLAPKPKPLEPFLNFLRPFSSSVWLMLAVSWIACSLMTYAVTRNARDNKYMSLWRIFLDFYGMIWGQNQIDTLRSPKSTIFTMIFAFWIVGMFFKVTAYTCNLRAYIIKEEFEKPIDTVEDLMRLNRDLYTFEHHYLVYQYKNSADKFKRSVYDKMIKRKTIFETTQLSSAQMPPSVEMRMIREGGARAVIKVRASMLMVSAEKRLGYQPFRQSKPIADSSLVIVFMFPMYQPWKEEVDKIFLQLVAAGIVDRLNAKYIPRNKYDFKDEVSDDDELKPFKLKHVAGPLFVLIMGLAISTNLACLEKFWRTCFEINPLQGVQIEFPVL